MKPFLFCSFAVLCASGAQAQTFKAEPFSGPAKPTKNAAPKIIAPTNVATNAAPRKSAHAPTPIERNARDVAALKLAQNKAASLPIVISGKASAATRAAAQELALYLGQMSGATFAVQTPDGKAADLAPLDVSTAPKRDANALAETARRALPAMPLPASGIVLGSADEFSIPADLKTPLTIRDGINGREAFAIRTQPKRLLLLGATDRAVSHAAFRLLHEMGCRWFFPGKNWEVVPSEPSLQFARDITDRPTVLTRNIWYAWGYFDKQAAADYMSWKRHNLQDSSLVVNSGHAWQEVVKENAEAFRAHPEYFAEIGGKRTGLVFDKDGKPVLDKDGKQRINPFTKVETTNPAVRQMFVDYALNFFKKNPDADMVSVDPSDGGGHSQSAESKAEGTVSDNVFGLANHVARAVAKEFPGKMVGLLAYNYHMAPPKFVLEPNVYVEMALAFNESAFTTDQLIDMWPQKARNIGFYDYYSTWVWDQDRLPGGKIANLNYVRTALPRYAATNAVSLSSESSNNWGVSGRGYLVANALMWNPEADVDAVLADFYTKAFGAGAAAMQRYYERVDPSSGDLFSTNLFGQAFRDVDEASKLTQNRPDIQARLDDLKTFLSYQYLRWVLDGETDKEKRRALAVAIAQNVYANRYSYMTHWAGFSGSQGFTNTFGSQTKDVSFVPVWARKTLPPEWTGDRAAPPVWESAQRLAHAQIEADFQEGLKFFPAVEVEKIDFSLDDLVPVTLSDPASVGKFAVRAVTTPTLTLASHQGQGAMTFYSFAGEPISIEFGVGMYAQYRGRPAAIWTLSQPDGKGGKTVVREGSLPLTGEVKPLVIEVPKAGAYSFAINDRGSAWRAIAPVSQPAVFPLVRGGSPTVANGVFYVPKGTKQIQYFWNGVYPAAPSILVQPDGAAVSTNGNGQINTIPVPANMDGKLWRFHGAAWRQVLFFNIPNIVAPSAAQMMLPRNLAQKDGVSRRTK